MPEPQKRDPAAPQNLQIIIKDGSGKEWGTIFAPEKVFSSGSIGYYGSGKIENPESHERYQVGMNITLIGSKPQ
ncbi:MAG: hypothetical protein LBD37_00290 [Treponema sp.]|jgi:hypothetical protein|nr:hypothetical protein [Treponema sp.]